MPPLVPCLWSFLLQRRASFSGTEDLFGRKRTAGQDPQVCHISAVFGKPSPGTVSQTTVFETATYYVPSPRQPSARPCRSMRHIGLGELIGDHPVPTVLRDVLINRLWGVSNIAEVYIESGAPDSEDGAVSTTVTDSSSKRRGRQPVVTRRYSGKSNGSGGRGVLVMRLTPCDLTCACRASSLASVRGMRTCVSSNLDSHRCGHLRREWCAQPAHHSHLLINAAT
jgi:hypothetical protein